MWFFRRGPVIPLLRLSGTIGMATPLRPGLSIAALAGPIEKAFSVSRHRAVAVVINSPGGSPVQSSLIFRRIRQLAEEKDKRVHVFCEDVAASGGYYLAAAGDEIYADASSIIDYLVYAKNYVAECEERYGLDVVELTLDSCHALMNHGVDRYRRPSKLSLAQEQARREEREAYAQRQINDMWRTLPRKKKHDKDGGDEGTLRRFPEEPQENILYFIEKNAPLLEPWQREIVRIVRKIAQYFYPQRQTQVMNEGWATFWHHHLLNTMYDDGHLSDGMMMEWLKSHTNVIYQPPVGHRAYSGINPYALGFAMYTDIKRIGENPTDEDRYWFPDIAGKDWLETLDHAMRNFKDESFIGQYLSPHLMREFRLFAILDDERESELEVSAIHDEVGYRRVREALSHQYDLGAREPNIQVWSVNTRGDRSLVLRHSQHNNRPLHESAHEVLKHVARLWGFGVHMESVDSAGNVTKRWSVPAPTH